MDRHIKHALSTSKNYIEKYNPLQEPQVIVNDFMKASNFNIGVIQITNPFKI